jgi:demethylmenaquinone methyltransferase / 2-methoxy-6-polyprenyl-1,4-benzoquinol methylase
MSRFAHDEIVPQQDSNASKKEQVATMFNQIAHRYDFLNRFLSAGIDVQWRKKAIRTLKKQQPKILLDVATGTADVALLSWDILQPQHITGIDISEGMLNLGREKVNAKGLAGKIDLLTADSEHLPFANNHFDAITVAFGVRNFEHLEKGLTEMLRVLKPGGQLVILEFSKPRTAVFKQLYQLYMNRIAPGFGNIFAKNKAAYQYLNHSVQAFPEGEAFVEILSRCGYQQPGLKKLSMGICTIYTGNKITPS